MLLSPRLFASGSDRQFGDLVALNHNVVVEDEGIGKTGLVEVAVTFGRDCNFAVAGGDFEDFEGDLGPDNFLVAPDLNRGDAAELPACVIDDGALGEAGDESGGIVVVCRPDIGGDGRG